MSTPQLSEETLDNYYERTLHENLAKLSKHEHRYTVPVEYSVQQSNLDTSGKFIRTKSFSVTKLRCEICPEEITREV